MAFAWDFVPVLDLEDRRPAAVADEQVGTALPDRGQGLHAGAALAQRRDDRGLIVVHLGGESHSPSTLAQVSSGGLGGRGKTGLTLNLVPYKGGAPAIADLLANQVPLAISGSPVVVGHIKAGRIRGLGITREKRHPLLPDVPTFVESGVADFVVAHWYGFLAPAGTPPAVVKLLHQEVDRALEQADVRERFANLALDIAPLGPDDFRRMIEGDVRRWKEVVAKSGIKPI